jgi:hypothetical protein
LAAVEHADNGHQVRIHFESDDHALAVVGHTLNPGRTSSRLFPRRGKVETLSQNGTMASAIRSAMSVKQCAQPVTNDFALTGVVASTNLGLNDFGHFVRPGDAELLGGPHGATVCSA